MLVLLLVPALFAIGATPAFASDESIEKAWDSFDPQYVKLDKQRGKAADRWARSGYKRVKPVIRILNRELRVLRRNIRAVKREVPSSATGARAKRHALIALRDYGPYIRTIRRAFILNTRYRDARGNKLARRRDRIFRRGLRHSKKARRLFAQARREAAAKQRPAPTPKPSPQPSPQPSPDPDPNPLPLP